LFGIDFGSILITEADNHMLEEPVPACDIKLIDVFKYELKPDLFFVNFERNLVCFTMGDGSIQVFEVVDDDDDSIDIQ
jgi:hypothetical protein